MNIVLITSSLDAFSTRFKDLPGKPVAIIEFDDWHPSKKIKKALRRILRLMAPKRFNDLERQARSDNLRWYPVAKTEKYRIKDILNQEVANLVITSRCPVIPMDTLDELSHGAINLHHSLLPAYRGGDPLFWQVLNGEEMMGVTVHRLTAVFDSGPILNQIEFERPKYLRENELRELINRDFGFPAIKKTVQQIIGGNEKIIDQLNPEKASLAPNGKRGNWRDLVPVGSNTDERIKDIETLLS